MWGGDKGEAGAGWAGGGNKGMTGLDGGADNKGEWGGCQLVGRHCRTVMPMTPGCIRHRVGLRRSQSGSRRGEKADRMLQMQSLSRLFSPCSQQDIKRRERSSTSGTATSQPMTPETDKHRAHRGLQNPGEKNPREICPTQKLDKIADFAKNWSSVYLPKKSRTWPNFLQKNAKKIMLLRKKKF
jgi:hypothetical protein